MVSDSFRIRIRCICLEIFVLPTNHLYTVFILVCRHIYPLEFSGYRSAIIYFRAAMRTRRFLIPQPKFAVFHPTVTKPAIMPRKPVFLLHFFVKPPCARVYHPNICSYGILAYFTYNFNPFTSIFMAVKFFSAIKKAQRFFPCATLFLIVFFY